MTFLAVRTPESKSSSSVLQVEHCATGSMSEAPSHEILVNKDYRLILYCGELDYVH